MIVAELVAPVAVPEPVDVCTCGCYPGDSCPYCTIRSRPHCLPPAPVAQTTSPHLPAPTPPPAVVNDNPMDFDRDLTDADVVRYVNLPIDDQIRYEDSFRKGMARTNVIIENVAPVKRLGNLRRRQSYKSNRRKEHGSSGKHGC